MSSQRYPPEFKDEAVRQVLERGYTVAEVSQRLGVSAHSLYKWVKAVKPDKSDEQAAELVEAKSEILRLRAQMRRIEEERKPGQIYFSDASLPGLRVSTLIPIRFSISKNKSKK